MDKKDYIIIGGVVLAIAAAGGGYWYYQQTLTKAARAKFNGKMAVFSGIPYWFQNGNKYTIDTGTYADLGTAATNKLLMPSITTDEFGRFKDGGSFNFQGFVWDGFGGYSDSNVNVDSGWFFDGGSKRKVDNWDFWSKIKNTVFNPPNIYLPQSVLDAIPVGSPINAISDFPVSVQP